MSDRERGLGLHLATFSLVARCPRSGLLGVTVATAVPAVGSICPFLRPGVGAVSTQSWVNPYLAVDALDRMATGESAGEVLARVLEADPARDQRQLGLVDAQGGSAAWTGAGCVTWCGDKSGPGFAAQGNMLTGPETIDAMVEAFVASEAESLDERLMRALEAADAAGGDKRGKQSASLTIQGPEAYPWLDLRVDEHAQPVAELRRVLEIARLQLLPFVQGMPKRDGEAGAAPAEVTEMLLKPPPERPGGGGSAH